MLSQISQILLPIRRWALTRPLAGGVAWRPVEAYRHGMRVSFRAYVKTLGSEDAAFSEFVADAQRDRSLPDAETWAELRGYLKRRGATRRFIREALQVWHVFSAARFIAQLGGATMREAPSTPMRTVSECLSKADEMDMRGERCGAADLGAQYFELGIRWRDLARRALRQDKWSEMQGLP